MADDRHYVGGDWYFLDQNTGFKVRAAKSRLQWDSIRTSGTHWNARHPQDMVQGVRDEQAPPWALPRQTNQFAVVATYVTALSARGSHSMQVESTVGISVGDTCQALLDQGSPFSFTVSGINGNTLSWAAPPLPGTVGGSFGDPIQNQVLDLTASPPVSPAPIN